MKSLNTHTKIAVLLLIVVVMALSGCAAPARQDIAVPQTPRYISTPTYTAAPVQTTDGSLYVDRTRVAQINDFRAYDINDLVTIKVVESTTATNSANMETEKDDTGTRGISSLLGLENRLFPRSVDHSSAYAGDTDEEFSSTGSNTRRETVTTTLTARIVDRLPNGNLILQAVREIIVSNERQVMVVQGIIRPVDIDDTNSILSTKIADLQIQYAGTGTLTENMRRGWLTRMIGYVWPY